MGQPDCTSEKRCRQRAVRRVWSHRNGSCPAISRLGGSGRPSGTRSRRRRSTRSERAMSIARRWTRRVWSRSGTFVKCRPALASVWTTSPPPMAQTPTAAHPEVHSWGPRVTVAVQTDARQVKHHSAARPATSMSRVMPALCRRAPAQEAAGQEHWGSSARCRISSELVRVGDAASLVTGLTSIDASPHVSRI
ncbi:hypothetical protein DFJ74DRAFT_664064, partial [Hyaloraphidium curvatum]